MSLSNDLRLWEADLEKLLLELRELRQRAANLEEQNQILREKVAAENIRGEGLESLSHLYDEGFHVCHAHFAQQRQEDCLFCLSLLHQVDAPENKTGE